MSNPNLKYSHKENDLLNEMCWVCCLTEFQGFKLREVSRCTELIEDMIIPLFIRLENKERKKNKNSI